MSSVDPLSQRRNLLRKNMVAHPERLPEAAPRIVLSKETRKNLLYGGIGAFILIVVFMIMSIKPPQGTIMYGVCKSYVELHNAFPSLLTFRSVEQYPAAVRVDYTGIDAFGQYFMNTIECTFVEDPVYGIMVDKIYINRKELPTEAVREFRIGVPSLYTNKPDMTLPPPVASELVDLWQGKE